MTFRLALCVLALAPLALVPTASASDPCGSEPISPPACWAVGRVRCLVWGAPIADWLEACILVCPEAPGICPTNATSATPCTVKGTETGIREEGHEWVVVAGSSVDFVQQDIHVEHGIDRRHD